MAVSNQLTQVVMREERSSIAFPIVGRSGSPVKSRLGRAAGKAWSSLVRRTG